MPGAERYGAFWRTHSSAEIPGISSISTLSLEVKADFAAVFYFRKHGDELRVAKLTERLLLPCAVIARTFAFLIDTRPVIARAGGGHEVGPKLTHNGADSPLVIKHHQNWRLKGMKQMVFKGNADLFYTAPMSLSRETATQIRSELPSFIEKIIKWVGPSPSETVRCLNIDWFEYYDSQKRNSGIPVNWYTRIQVDWGRSFKVPGSFFDGTLSKKDPGT
jgi:hypothetical protein